MECVQQKFESVYLHVIKKHRNNLLFSYYELEFRCFDLNLFSHCFDSVRFKKFKPEPALRTLDWKDSLFTSIKFTLSQIYVVYVSIKYGLRTTDYGLRTTDYGLRTTDYGLRTTDYGLRTTDYGLRTTDYGLRTTDYGLWTSDWV